MLGYREKMPTRYSVNSFWLGIFFSLVHACTAHCSDVEAVMASTGLKAGDSAGESMRVELGGGVGMELVWIPAGAYLKGSPQSEPGHEEDESPQSSAAVESGFWMGKCEITQEQWKAVMRDNPSFHRGDDNPVNDVNWQDCKFFIKRLNRLTKRSFRLPTETEWEYACRAGSTSRFCFGDDTTSLGEYAWFLNNSGDDSFEHGRTHPVGKKKPNSWGLHDMHGNVWEWCEDLYVAYGTGKVISSSSAATQGARVLRGGSWMNGAEMCRSASRVGQGQPAEYRLQNVGFRLVLPAP